MLCVNRPLAYFYRRIYCRVILNDSMAKIYLKSNKLTVLNNSEHPYRIISEAEVNMIVVMMPRRLYIEDVLFLLP